MNKMTELAIFIDTNVLLHSSDYGLNIPDEISRLINSKFIIFVHPSVESEIINTLTTKGKSSRQARLAIQLSSRFQSYIDDKIFAGADQALLETAEKENGCVLTFDKGLKSKCIKRNVPVISFFKKGRLKLFGYVEQ